MALQRSHRSSGTTRVPSRLRIGTPPPPAHPHTRTRIARGTAECAFAAGAALAPVVARSLTLARALRSERAVRKGREAGRRGRNGHSADRGSLLRRVCHPRAFAVRAGGTVHRVRRDGIPASRFRPRRAVLTLWPARVRSRRFASRRFRQPTARAGRFGMQAPLASLTLTGGERPSASTVRGQRR
jgi:hypothetical protein